MMNGGSCTIADYGVSTSDALVIVCKLIHTTYPRIANDNGSSINTFLRLRLWRVVFQAGAQRHEPWWITECGCGREWYEMKFVKMQCLDGFDERNYKSLSSTHRCTCVGSCLFGWMMVHQALILIVVIKAYLSTTFSLSVGLVVNQSLQSICWRGV